VPPLRFLNIGGNSIGDDGAAMVGAGLVEAAGLGLLMLRFFGLDNNSMYERAPDIFVTESLCVHQCCLSMMSISQIHKGYEQLGKCA
jgi:hypothetical protein